MTRLRLIRKTEYAWGNEGLSSLEVEFIEETPVAKTHSECLEISNNKMFDGSITLKINPKKTIHFETGKEYEITLSEIK